MGGRTNSRHPECVAGISTSLELSGFGYLGKGRQIAQLAIQVHAAAPASASAPSLLPVQELLQSGDGHQSAVRIDVAKYHFGPGQRDDISGCQKRTGHGRYHRGIASPEICCQHRQCSAAVPLLQATAWLAPVAWLNARSN